MTGTLNIVDLARVQMPPDQCSYLPQETWSLDYRLIRDIEDRNYEELLCRGWRRHGRYFFRPACPHCTKCRSLRIVVERFAPSKSQRRVLRRNEDVRVVVREPSVTPRHLHIFNAWHADMHRRRGWPLRTDTAEEYYEAFLAGRYDFASEFLYLRGRQLVGVGLVDAAPQALSSVYFYHDPEWRDDSPGTFSALQEIRYAQQTGRRHIYLGYWIAECPSMAYKNRFQPHEILERYPADDEEPVWRKVDG